MDLRRALQYATDRQAIRKLVFDNTGSVAYSQYPSVSWAHPQGLTVPYSLTLAKQELAKAGKPNGFSFTLQAQNTPEFIQLTQLLQSQWAQVGIKAKIETLDLATYLTNLHHVQMQADFINDSGAPDPDQTSFPMDTGTGSLNHNHYNSPQVNQWLTEARSISSIPQRAALYAKAAAQIVKDVPFIFLMHPEVFMAASAKLHGFQIYPSQMIDLSGVWLAK